MHCLLPRRSEVERIHVVEYTKVSNSAKHKHLLAVDGAVVSIPLLHKVGVESNFPPTVLSFRVVVELLVPLLTISSKYIQKLCSKEKQVFKTRKTNLLRTLVRLQS